MIASVDQTLKSTSVRSSPCDVDNARSMNPGDRRKLRAA
jgi:hypothetical protein